MTPEFMLHLQRNWPLTVVVVGLFLYLPVVLVGGVCFTNQGSISRAKEPTRYWRWVGLLLALFLASLGGPRRLLCSFGPMTTETGA